MRATTKALMRKEFFLTIPKPMYLYVLLSFMTCVPNYPIIVGIWYVTLFVFFIFQFSKENRDTEFTGMLPVSRNDAVGARVLTVMCIEAVQFVLAAGFAALGACLFPEGNIVGLDANPTFFGVALLSTAAFNTVFLPLFYRTGHKAGAPMLIGCVAFLGVYGIAEALVQAVPGAKAIFDTLNPAMMGWQCIVLGVGIIGFVALGFLSLRLSRKAFEKVDM